MLDIGVYVLATFDYSQSGGSQMSVNLPWIPVINRIPRWIPFYKIIYRKYYRSARQQRPGS